VAFANPLPWWVLALVVSGAAAIAWQTYRHMAASRARRSALGLLRFLTLLAIVFFLMRPVSHRIDVDSRDAVVPILVDTSRSMDIVDAGEAGQARRIDRARQILTERLLPGLGAQFRVEVLGFGEGLEPKTADQLTATARRSDLQSALGALRERYRGQVIAGAVLLSDGGDTSEAGEHAAGDLGTAIYPIGVGVPILRRDREVLSVTAAEAVLDDSRLDLRVTAIAHGEPSGPIDLRLLENGRAIQVAHLAPAAPNTPVHHVFHASPQRGAATVYTVDTPVLPGEPVPENNTRSVLVQGPSRPRRILLVEGAPGFEHSFLKRAWAGDQGLEVDAVVRKGKDEQGANTFYVQAAHSRSDALVSGYPQTLERLSTYDAIVLANVDAAMLTGAELAATREFVSRRGGGLLVLGSTSFARQGLVGTPVEDALPLQLSGRDGGALPAAPGGGVNRISLTSEGSAHPIMQIAEDPDATRKRWDGVPPLAGVAQLGGPRPGASVLAVAGGAGGTARALVAVQRYGQGRAMVFTGEASWRWRMHLPSADRTYETFWRQAVRWLALPAGDPIQLTLPAASTPGDTVPLRVAVRTASFEPLGDAVVDLRVSAPDGRMEQLRAAPSRGTADGVFETTFRPADPGVYRVTADARRGGTVLGSATASMLVGGADFEMTDPRLNTQLLQRIALASGGRVVAATEISTLAESLRARLPAAALAASRDLWNTSWSFLLIVILLSTEWVLRRRWGLR
jgi:uncharacterized membrane protein